MFLLALPLILAQTNINITIIADANVQSELPTTNTGTAAQYNAFDDGSAVHLTWIMFNNSIPADATINECLLNQTVTDFGVTLPVSVHGINTTLNTTDESSIIFNNHPCTTGSYNYFGNFNSCSKMNVTLSITGNGRWGFNVTNLTIAQHNNGQKNFTFVHRLTVSNAQAITFSSKEHATGP